MHSHFEASGRSAEGTWKGEITLLTLQITDDKMKFAFQETETKPH